MSDVPASLPDGRDVSADVQVDAQTAEPIYQWPLRHQKERALALLAASAFLLGLPLLNHATLETLVSEFVSAFASVDGTEQGPRMARFLVGIYMLAPLPALYCSFVALAFADSPDILERRKAENRINIAFGAVASLIAGGGVVVFARFLWPSLVDLFDPLLRSP